MNTRTLLSIVLLLHLFSGAARTTIPFQLVGRLVIIQATVNGNSGNYILDTGTLNLVLNDRRHTLDDARVAGQAVGISGEPLDIYSVVVQLSIGDEIWNGVKAEALPLDVLEQRTGIQIMGLIGTYVFLQYQLELDFKNRQLTLIKVAGRNRETIGDFDRPAEVLLPLGSKSGIPVLKILVGDQRLIFGLDTGSEVNILDAGFTGKLPSYLTFRRPKNLTGTHVEKQQVPAGLLHDVVFDQFYCPNLNIVVMPMDPFNKGTAGVAVDG